MGDRHSTLDNEVESPVAKCHWPRAPFIHKTFFKGSGMVTSIGVPGSLSFVTRSVFSSGQLLLADHCCQELPEIQQTTESSERTNGNTTDLLVAEASIATPADHAELINAAVPRVSCCVLEASMALSEKRIEDLCSQLIQASTILDEVLAAVIPRTDSMQQIETETALTAEVGPAVQVDLPPIARESELLPEVALPLAMAAAA
jgi:hypothetical protein